MSGGRKYRIGLDGSLACSSRPTGVEHFARSLLAEVVRLEVPDVEWHVYLPPKGDPGTELPATVRTHYRPDVNTLVKTPWFVGRTWLDRLQVVYSFGHLLPTGCHGREVVTVHDTAFDQYPDCYAPGDAEKAHAQVAEACRRSARIVVPSEATRQGLIRGYGFPRERADVIYEGGRSAFVPGPAGALPEKVSAAGIEAPFLLCVGRLDRRKNLERVIEAYRLLLQEGVAIGGLVIAGPDDSGSAAVKARLQAGQVPGERIVTTGYVTEDELVSLYRAAAALVYPSLAEGFGLPVLEAMSCGTPTITSSVSSMPEVAGDAALLVDPVSAAEIASAIRRVLLEPGLSSTLRRDGMAQAATFSWRRSAERLVESLLAEVGRS